MDIGVISDTHGRIHPGALKTLRGARRIFHAGDIGGRHVLESLEQVAPAAAVLGNADDPNLHRIIPWHRVEEVGWEERDGILYVNPGSVGSPRFGLVPSVARLRLGRRAPEAVILPFDPRA